MSVALDVPRFTKRLKVLYEKWRENGTVWDGANMLAVLAGAAAEDIRYWKSSSLHLWLLGYEFTDTVLLFTPTEIHALSGSKKTDILRQLEGACQEAAGVTLHLHTKPKKESGEQQINELIDVIKASKGDASEIKVGTLPKEKPSGALADAWKAALAETGTATVDIGPALASVMAVKDDDEVKNVRKAGFLVSSAVTNRAVKDIEETIDQEKKVKHTKLAERLEEVISDPSKIDIKLKAEVVDVAYPPVIQSGGKYDFKLSASSNDSPLHYGVIVVSAGARYSSYCANIARTYFVDPSKTQEEEYAALLAAQNAAIAALVPGAPMSAAYEATVKVLEERNQKQLVEKLTKNVGTAIGLELRDNTQQLNATNTNTVQPGMTFNVAVGVTDLTRDDAEDEAGKKYAITIADTVVVKPEGAPDVATMATSRDWKEVAYFLKGDEDEAESEDGDEEEGAEEEPQQNVPVRKSARTEHVDFQLRDEERRRQKENQEELLEKVNQATLQMLNKGGKNAEAQRGTGRKLTDLQAYRSVKDMQHNNTLTVQVDHRNECVLVPLYGMLVPLHIMTVKNATMNQDNEHAYIRLNFNFGPAYEPGAKFASSVFLKELSFRTADPKHAQKIVQEVKALRSQVQQREKERVERATLVQQEKLVRAKGKVYVLPDVWIRPAFGTKGRKVTGTLEAHTNGFRYSSPKGEELDIMYRNIKHAFYQPAEKEMITLIHFHLIHPIMVGKKKTNDVQFYTEVMDTVQTLDAGRRSMYDPDEIEEEQRERERRNQINRQFNAFVKRVQQDIWERDFGDLNLEFEIPFRELGFHGVPARSTSFIMPTVNCLVELTELPFTVITLSEVNLVNLERVGFNLRNFDMIFVWKDLDRDVGRIDAIPSQSIETIKDWLTSIEIKYYESKVNLNWKNVLKSIKEDPEAFVEAGGWNFLDADETDSEEEDQEESDFAPSEDGGAEESEEEESSEDESLVESDDEDESDYEVGSEEEEGLEWDELEKQAAREDKEREFSDGEDDRRKRKGGGGSGPMKKARR